MTTIILIGDAVECACDSVSTDSSGNRIAMIAGVAAAVYPPHVDLTVVAGVTLPQPWPGHGYTYANGEFSALEEVVEPGPVPQSVTNFQGRAALHTLGIFDDVQNAIDAVENATQRAIYQEAFDRAGFHRDSAFLNSVAAGLGMSSEDVDDMFRAAAAIKV